MPGVVDARVAHSGRGQQRLPGPPVDARVRRLSGDRREHPAAVRPLPPQLAGGEPLGGLSLAVRPEGVDQVLGQADRAPAASGLRLDCAQPAAYALRAAGGAARRAALRLGAAVPPRRTAEGAVHSQRPRVEVDVVPAEPERLSLAETEPERQHPAGAVAPALGRRQDGSRLVGRQRHDLGGFGARRPGQARRAQLGELDGAEGADGVADVRAIGLQRGRLARPGDHVEPGAQPLGDALATSGAALLAQPPELLQDGGLGGAAHVRPPAPPGHRVWAEVDHPLPSAVGGAERRPLAWRAARHDASSAWLTKASIASTGMRLAAPILTLASFPERRSSCTVEVPSESALAAWGTVSSLGAGAWAGACSAEEEASASMAWLTRSKASAMSSSADLA